MLVSRVGGLLCVSEGSRLRVAVGFGGDPPTDEDNGVGLVRLAISFTCVVREPASRYELRLFGEARSAGVLGLMDGSCSLSDPVSQSVVDLVGLEAVGLSGASEGDGLCELNLEPV